MIVVDFVLEQVMSILFFFLVFCEFLFFFIVIFCSNTHTIVPHECVVVSGSTSKCIATGFYDDIDACPTPPPQPTPAAQTSTSRALATYSPTETSTTIVDNATNNQGSGPVLGKACVFVQISKLLQILCNFVLSLSTTIYQSLLPL
jgi:hypothetical protein